MKFLFNINNESHTIIFDNSMSIIDIKRELLKQFFDENTKYLDFYFKNNRPVKHFGKLSLEPGLIPTTMDKCKLSRFSISNIDTLIIDVKVNNECNLLEVIDNIPENINFQDRIMKRMKNEEQKNEPKIVQVYEYKEEDFPSLS